MVLYCNFRSLAFWGLLGFLRRQLKLKLIATLLRAAKYNKILKGGFRGWLGVRVRGLGVEGLGFRV